MYIDGLIKQNGNCCFFLLDDLFFAHFLRSFHDMEIDKIDNVVQSPLRLAGRTKRPKYDTNSRMWSEIHGSTLVSYINNT